MKHSLKIKMAGVAFLALMAVMVAVMVAVSLPRGEPALAQDAGICGRTLQVREAILQKVTDVTDCAAVTDSHLSAITGTMIISEEASLTLQDGDFAGLSGLEYLYLNLNSLSTLPEDIFDGLTDLKELYPYNNNLTALPEGVFDDLGSLQKLNLGYNSIAAPRADAFDELSDLQELHLEHNDLASLPDGIFDGLSNLTTLNLAANDLQSLPSGTFSGLGSLQTLRLSGNPGAPFTFTTALSEPEPGKVTLTVAEGAPVDMTVTLSASGGTLSATTVTIDGGETASDAVTVTQDGSEAVTVTVASVVFDSTAVLEGLQTGPGQDLELANSTTEDTTAPGNSTGLPTITGTAEVGETLTADTSGIEDEDGLDNATFTYQWVRSDGTADLNNVAAPFQWNPTDGTADLDIDGATGATYTITATDVGHAIKVRVGYTDDEDNTESLTSSATVTVPIEVAFTFNIEGTSVTCESYNVHIVNIPIEECDDPTSTEQGASGAIEVELEIARSVSSQSYKFNFHIYQMEDSLGHYMTREANDLCLGPGLAASALMEVTPDGGTGPFTYTDDGTIFELCPAGTFQLYVPWYRYNNTDQEYEHAGTFRRYFFITSDDEADPSIEQVKRIRALYPDPPVSRGAVQIEATKESTVLNRELATYSLSIGGLVPDSDLETTDYAVRLRVLPGDNARYKEVPWCHVGKVGYSYLFKTVPEDGGWAMEAHVLGNCISHSRPEKLRIELFNGSYEYIAGRSIVFRPQPNTSATGQPIVSGTPQVGETLTADTSGIADEDGLDDATFSYQWIANDGTSDADITGATGPTYALADAEEDKTVKVKVSFTDDAGNEESLTSGATAVVEPKPNTSATGQPTISGTAQVGETLTADTSGIADADGLNNVSFSYQWLASRDTEIDGATSSTYTLQASDEGKAIKLRVSFTDDAGNEESLTSAATEAVVVGGL